MSREGIDVPKRAGLRLRCELRAWRYRRSVRCADRRQDRHERSPERLRHFLARRQSFAVLESERVLSHFGGTATMVPASDYVSTFRAKGLSRISLPCRSDYVSTLSDAHDQSSITRTLAAPARP